MNVAKVKSVTIFGFCTTFKRRKLGRLSFDRHFARNEVSGFYCLIMLHTSQNTATKVLIFFERKHSDFLSKLLNVLEKVVLSTNATIYSG